MLLSNKEMATPKLCTAVSIKEKSHQEENNSLNFILLPIFVNVLCNLSYLNLPTVSSTWAKLRIDFVPFSCSICLVYL
jgi:hypothetical protein